MGNVEKRKVESGTRWYLADRPLANGDEVELRLYGRAGWALVRVEGLPERLDVRWAADDGRELHTSLPPDAELRWP
jgi:hypothetical protein